MRKILILLFCPLLVFSQTKYCSKIEGENIINKTYLTISYNTDYNIPNYVGYYLIPSFLKGNSGRESVFYAEEALPLKYRVYSKEYLNTGYDRGHMSPAADWHGNEVGMHESFSMANICPQRPQLNRRSWLALEKLEREYTLKCDTLFIITGEVCEDMKSIGRIRVPSYFYKAVVGVKNKKITISKAWVYKNIDTQQQPYKCEITIKKLETKLGIKLFWGFWFKL